MAIFIMVRRWNWCVRWRVWRCHVLSYAKWTSKWHCWRLTIRCHNCINALSTWRTRIICISACRRRKSYNSKRHHVRKNQIKKWSTTAPAGRSSRQTKLNISFMKEWVQWGEFVIRWCMMYLTVPESFLVRGNN